MMSTFLDYALALVFSIIIVLATSSNGFAFGGKNPNDITTGSIQTENSEVASETKLRARALATLNYITPITINIGNNICSKDKSFKKLTEARMRFYTFYRMLHPYSQKKAYGYNPSTYYHQSLPPINIDYVQIIGAFILRMDKEQDALTSDVFPFGPLIKELLKYYNKVTTTKNWKNKFKVLAEQNLRPQIDKLWPYLQLDLGREFHRSGFPAPENNCYMMRVAMDYDIGNMEGSIQIGSRYFDKESNLEMWLYSFWLRRYVDGSMDKVHTILAWADNIVNESFFRRHKQATAFSGDMNSHSHDAELESLYRSFIVGEASWKKTGKSTYIYDAFRVPLPYKHAMERQYIGTRDVAVNVLNLLSYQDKCSMHLQKVEIMPDSNGHDVTYLKYLINGGMGCKGTPYFASIAPLSELSERLYRPSKVTNSEMKLIQAGLNSSIARSNLHAYIKDTHKIFIAWDQEVFSLNEDGSIHGIWIPKGFHRISLNLNRPGFIADLDDDGKLELLFDEASGLGGDTTINEVDESKRDMLVKISSWSEGEGQPTYYHDYSSSLLAPVTKVKE